MKIKKVILKIMKVMRNILRKTFVPIKKLIYFIYGLYSLLRGKLLLKKGKDREAVKTWVHAANKVTNNSKLNLQLAKYVAKNRDWKICISYLNEGLFGETNNNVPKVQAFYKWIEYNILVNTIPPVDSFKQAALMYRKNKMFQEADAVLEKGLKLWARNKDLYNEYAINAIHNKEWVSAISRFQFNKRLYKDGKVPLTLLVRLSMLYQIIGYGNSQVCFGEIIDPYAEEIENDPKGYRKITLFDNGESRIEFYKKLKPVSKVIITFDSINMIWSNPPFGFKLLKEQDVDIIAVRKRKSATYQQDLSQEDFIYAVSTLLSSYDDKIAYGFSLGGYAALYYASNLNCRILAISPRLSIHPEYGRRAFQGRHKFLHNLSHNYNERISPIIVFDPKNKVDNTYVQGELVQSFPKLHLVEIPYGGHGMAPHLLKMGLLKEFILTVIDGKQTPTYDRNKRTTSSLYYRVLAQTCFSRNKNKWALGLVERSLELLPTDKIAIKLKVKALNKMNKTKESIYFLQEIVPDISSDMDLWLLLIDLYIEVGDLFNAEMAIKEAEKTRKGKVQQLEDRKQLILNK